MKKNDIQYRHLTEILEVKVSHRSPMKSLYFLILEILLNIDNV